MSKKYSRNMEAREINCILQNIMMGQWDREYWVFNLKIIQQYKQIKTYKNHVSSKNRCL